MSRTSRQRPVQATPAGRDWIASGIDTGRSLLDEALDTPLLPASAAVTPAELIPLLRAAATATRSGTPAAATFSMFADGPPDRALGSWCTSVATSLLHGEPVAAALARQGTLPPAALAVIAAAERAGHLPDGLDTAADLLSDDQSAAAAVRSAVRQPAAAATGVVTVLAAAAWLTEPLLNRTGTSAHLPTAAHLLLRCTQLLPLTVLAAVAVTLVVKFLLRLPLSAASTRARVDRWLLAVPGVKGFLTRRARWRVAATAAVLLQAGASCAEAFRAAAPTAGNAAIAAAAGRAADRLDAGDDPAAAISTEPLLGRMLVAAAATGHRAGTLPAALGAYAEYARTEADQAASKALARIEPAAAAASAVVVLAWLTGLVLPVLLAAS